MESYTSTKNRDPNDIHPDLDEIDPYVAIGPTPDLSIFVHKNTFDTGFIVFTIIFGFGIILLIALTTFFSYNVSKLPPPPPPLQKIDINPALHTNYGGVSQSSENVIGDAIYYTNEYQCLQNKNTSWNKIECQCKNGFFGPDCNREKHDKRYFSVGHPNINQIKFNEINKIKSNGKSFNTNNNFDSCSQKCNTTQNCIGFIYDKPNLCTLLSDTVIIPKGIDLPYSPDIESTLYLKSSDDLYFKNRVFLGLFSRSFPPRYWLVKEAPGYIQLSLGIMIPLSFTPTYTKIYGNYIGIYSLNKFDPDDIELILNYNPSEQIYIHYPSQDLNLPINFQYRTIYVMYIE